MRQSWAIWLKNQIQGAGIKLKKERKTHENAITTSYKQGIPREMASIKFKRSMKLLLKDMAGLKKGPLQPKGGNSTWEPNGK